MTCNVLLILADELRYDCLGCTGNPIVQTPQLDRLAASGVLARQHRCSNPICTPARASLLTGHYPRTHGAVHVGHRLDRRFPTLADRLGAAGYRCGLFGKSHLEAELSGFADRLDPAAPYYGFGEHALCEDAPYGPYWHWLADEHPQLVAEARKQLNEEFHAFPPPDGSGRLQANLSVALLDGCSMTDWITDRTLDFIAARPADEPFYAVCSYVDPHHPWSPVGRYAGFYDPEAMPDPPRQDDDPPDWIANPYCFQPDLPPAEYRRMVAAYYGMISHVDASVGRLLDALAARGDDTLVIFTSDHGDYNGDQGLIRKGNSLHPSLVRVPLLLHLPGGPAGATYDGLSQHEDLLPTILAACGQTPPADLPGHDLGPSLCQQAPPPRDYAYLAYENRPRDARRYQTYGITDGCWTRLWTAGGPGLVDEHADPLHRHDRLADPACASHRQELETAMLDWFIRTPEYRKELQWRW